MMTTRHRLVRNQLLVKGHKLTVPVVATVAMTGIKLLCCVTLAILFGYLRLLWLE